jgi:hypothetical protein
MSGERLYKMYCRHHLARTRCSIDEWQDLTNAEQSVWNELADELLEDWIA